MSDADDIAYQEMRILDVEDFKYVISGIGITTVAVFLVLGSTSSL